MINKVDELIKSLREYRLNSAVLIDVLEENENLQQLINMPKVSSFVGVGQRQLIVRTYSYPQLLDMLKLANKILPGKMEFDMNWFSAPHMIFAWGQEWLKIWFDCEPEQIPPQLMPSETCKVEVEERIEKDYRLVCEVRK